MEPLLEGEFPALTRWLEFCGNECSPGMLKSLLLKLCSKNKKKLLDYAKPIKISRMFVDLKDVPDCSRYTFCSTS